MAAVTFREWLMCQTSRPSAIGDLARDVKSDSHFPKGASRFHMIIGYFRQKGACDGAIQALKDGFAEYRTLDKLACMVDSLPNGCSLIHFCTGVENNHSAWKVVSWTGELLAYGRSARAALIAFETGEKNREWWEAQLRDIGGFPDLEGGEC